MVRAEKPRIVVLGSGFAGLGALEAVEREMDSVDLVMVSESGVFEYIPSVPELVSGRVTPDDITAEVRRAVGAVGQFIEGRVEELDLSGRRVRLMGGESIEYDALVICLGAEPLAPEPLPRGCSTTYRLSLIHI